MKVVVFNKNNEARLNKFLDWLIYMVGYTLVFLAVSTLFKSFYIDKSFYGLYSFLAVIIIYVLNKTIKPILVYLTLPITGLTLGLFYPLINVFILKITDLILGTHFDLSNIYVAVIIAILISLMNQLMENLIIKPMIRRFRHE